MASNKNQHFVPRCYLRPFTVGEGGAAINVFNIDRKRVIPFAPVKNQCSGDYFYGKDENLEAAIRATEEAYASTLREVRTAGQVVLPRHREVLLMFWLFQYMRTEAASRRSTELASDIEAFADPQDKSFRYGIKEAVQIAMRIFAETNGIVDDLKLCLVRNRTSIPFITSDDPAVLSNRWYLEDIRGRGRSFGLRSSGALAFLPLTPEVACIAYDGDVYSIPHENGWVKTSRAADVCALNQHQFLNCFANVFVRDMADSTEAVNQFLTAEPRRLTQRRRLNTALQDKVDGDHTRYRVVSHEEARAAEQDVLIHSETLHHNPSSWPAFIHWRRPGRVYTNGTGLKYVREKFAVSLQSTRQFWREGVKRG